jgi:Tol biopolymer transport system component
MLLPLHLGPLHLGPAQGGATELVSVDSLEAHAGLPSSAPALSADGQRVVFSTLAPLAAGDANGLSDVYLRDLAAGTTVRISASAAGPEPDGGSFAPALSADGRLCAFASDAENLVPGDDNGVSDVFVKDLQSGALWRVSVATGGAQADGPSGEPALADGGSAVAFASLASNLDGPDQNPSWDVFVHDLESGATELVSRSSAGVQALGKCADAALSTDGALVAFASTADNLVPGDTNASWDVFVRDRAAGTTVRASVGAAGEQGSGGSFEPVFAAGGALLAFEGEAVGLMPEQVLFFSDVFVKDLASGALELVSISTGGVQGNLSSGSPALSTDGRYAAFRSRAENLVPGDGTGPGGWDVFLRDRLAGITVRVSTAPSGGDPDGTSSSPAVSADGGLVAFDSLAENLVAGDANGVQDVFARAEPVEPWVDLGSGLAGAAGVPSLAAAGGLAPFGKTLFALSGGAPAAPGAWVFGLSAVDLPLFGGVLVPAPTALLPLVTGASGAAQLGVPWPPSLPPGLALFAQAWLLDAGGPQGFAAANALTQAAF